MSSGRMVRLLPLLIVAFCGFTGFSMLFPVIPGYTEEVLGAQGHVMVGLVVGTFYYVSALTMIPSGVLSDRIGRRLLFMTGVVGCTVVPLLYIVANSLLWLILVRGIHGLAAACLVPAANALVVDMAPPERKGEAIGWFTTAMMAGFMVGPITGGFLLQLYGFDATFYACSSTTLLALVLILPWLRSMPDKPVPVVEAVGVSWTWLRQRRAFGALLTLILIAFGSGTIVAFMPLYGERIAITASHVGAIITGMYGGSILLRTPAGILSDRIGRAVVILSGFVMSAAALALFSVFATFPLLMVAGVAFGVGMGLAVTASFALVADLASSSARGLAMGAANCFSQAGLGIGAVAMGGVAAVAGFDSMFGICGAILAAGLVIVIFLIRRGSG